ncbi:MAG: haloacid dehalogenase type II [Leifsonia sp.]
MSATSPVIVFDVNETLSDLSPLAGRFVDIGAPVQLAKLWFNTLLRDGFALTAAGHNRAFADIGAGMLRLLLAETSPTSRLEHDVQYVMNGMNELELHADVVDAVRSLKAENRRMITLTNGSSAIAEKLFTSAGIRECFEGLLSVENAAAWKPARAAYEYAATACRVEPSEMILVAVHPWDIHGAAAAGLRTAWLNRCGEDYPAYFAAPQHTLHRLGDLSHYV